MLKKLSADNILWTIANHSTVSEWSIDQNMPRTFVNMAGMRFGRLTVSHPGPCYKEGKMWHCWCDCGNSTLVLRANLIKGHVRSCGCYRREYCQENAAECSKHGHKSTLHKGKRTATYCSWEAMRQRCNNPNHREYFRYGGRNIKVCERWNDFRNFLADMGERPQGKTLDRINGLKGYEPSNCRWATISEQNSNKLKRRKIC